MAVPDPRYVDWQVRTRFELVQGVTVGARRVGGGRLAVTYKAGTRLVPYRWRDESEWVEFLDFGADGSNWIFLVPKKLLRPVDTPVAGVAPYDAGLDAVVRDFERGEQDIEAEKTRKGGSRPDEPARASRNGPTTTTRSSALPEQAGWIPTW
jgi:hypothetical protein